MGFNELLPSNWGRRQLPIRRSDDWGGVPSFDRLFDDFFNDFGMPRLNEMSTQFMPALDVSESEKEVKITAELPGMDEKDIEISLANNLLSISGEKKSKTEESDKGYYRVERRYGSFSRSVQLPAGLDTEKIEASYKNGLLTVTLPKTAEYQSSVKKIRLNGDGEQRTQ